MRRRAAIALAIVGVVAVVGGLIALLHSPGNVSHPNLSFTAPKTPAKRLRTATFQWPVYGYNDQRTRDFAAPKTLVPPFRVGWSFDDGALLEFPPVIYGTTLFVLDDDGAARAIDVDTGQIEWFHKIGTLAAASPAVAVRQHLLIMVLLSTTPGAQTGGNGRVVAMTMQSGRTVWSRPISSGSESSPIVHGNSVYFGDQAGTVYSLNVATGAVQWTYHAAASVKGGLAFQDGVLYFGDYAGRAYAINARTGHAVWAVGTSGEHFGFGSGNFYSTPAVAFGRVYMGNTDGRVYSFAQSTGQLAWATATGAYVYASPAVGDIRGLGPTVYIGSYDGNLYAFNAQSGAIRWSHPAGGKISGAATIVGPDVYYSDLATKSTTGLDARTGRTVFTYDDGAFNPVIADDNEIIMDGYGEMYQLLPKRPAAARTQRTTARTESRR